MKLILLVFLTSLNGAILAQNKKRGIIIFESDYGMYFIETQKTSFISLLNSGKDTVTAYMLYTRDGACNLKNYLNHTVYFDSIKVTIKRENYLGLHYEDDIWLATKYGQIEYNNKQSYKLKPRYQTYFLKNKIFVLWIEDFMPIEEFLIK